MSIVGPGPLEPMVGDPDDHRPATRWRLLTDPGEQGRAARLGFIEESIAVGDAIPLHTHDVDEVIAILDGDAEARVGDTSERVGPRTVIFIPAGTPHGTRNAGPGPVLLHAVFPATEIELRYLERNPEPGTEGEAPRHLRLDLRSGDVEVIG